MLAALRRTVVATACLAALVLAGCGKHVASNAPITWAPADTPYLMANFRSVPTEIRQAWSGPADAAVSMDIQLLTGYAKVIGQQDPSMAAVLDAVHDELANVHTLEDLNKATGFSWPSPFAIYGVGDVPVARIELSSPDAFKAFWARVEKRAGIATPTRTVDNQTYWVIGGDHARLHVVVAIEGKQLVTTIAPANAGPDMLKQLLGLTKPANNASDRLARIDGEHGYSDYGSGYLDLPKLFANLYDGKDVVTQEFARDLGAVSLANPACASEFASLARQAPLASVGVQTYTAKEMRYSVDVKLSSALLDTLTTLKQPVPGMDETSDRSMFDLVLALPLQKWQAFMRDRAKAAAERSYRCPALQSLNKFAAIAADPPVQMPPEAASLQGFRLVLDKWEAGPQIAGRVLVASSNPAELTRKIQQTLPQFALKTIPTDGKAVAFPLPNRAQPMLGGNQGWIAADAHSIVVGVGDDEETRLSDALNAPAGNGDRLLRMHFDGKMYGVFASWMSRFATLAPAESQLQVQQMVGLFQHMSKTVASGDMDLKLDNKGLHMESDVKHR